MLWEGRGKERKRGMVAGARTRGGFLNSQAPNWSRTAIFAIFGANANATKMEIVAISIAITSHSYDVNVSPIILSRRLRHGSVAARADANRRTWDMASFIPNLAGASTPKRASNPHPPNEIRRRRAASMSNTLYQFTSTVTFGTSL
jgi:hypothetical protein